MSVLIIYDSVYGNTEKIAQAIGNALEEQNAVSLVRVDDANLDLFKDITLLVVGSPTQRFNTMPAISNLLKSIPDNSLKGVKVAAFDTRLSAAEINKTPVLGFFVKLWGKSAYAAQLIARLLLKKGGALVAPPEGFYVEGMEGPLAQGELERAAEWGKRLLQ